MIEKIRNRVESFLRARAERAVGKELNAYPKPAKIPGTDENQEAAKTMPLLQKSGPSPVGTHWDSIAFILFLRWDHDNSVIFSVSYVGLSREQAERSLWRKWAKNPLTHTFLG